jgi:hypothetical protein
VNLLFWNTGRREPLDELIALVKTLRVDVLILAECPLSAVEILERLNTGLHAVYHLPFNPADRLVLSEMCVDDCQTNLASLTATS